MQQEPLNRDTTEDISLGVFFLSSPRDLFRRTIFDESELTAFRPWLHLLAAIYMVCALAGCVLLIYGRLLLVPPAFAWAWLIGSNALIFLARFQRHVAREYLLTMTMSSVSVLGWVALCTDPMSSLVVFCNIVFITFVVLTLTPRAGFSLMWLTLIGLYAIRTSQMLLGIEAGLSLPPLSWIQASQVGVIFFTHFLSVTFLVNLHWVQKKRNQEAREELERSNTQLLASEQARTVFLSTITHELKTPLTNIHGYVDLMLADGRAHAHELGVVKRAATRLQGLIDEFLNLADPPSLAGRMAPMPICLNDVVAEEVGTLRSTAEARGVDLRFVAEAVCTVQADRVRLAQVVSNLVENALQHTPSGKTVTVGIASHDECTVLTVEDTGAGIPADVLPHIFHPFFTRESAVKRHKGMGLGLSICKQIVEASGGVISATSTLGRGTQFTVKLPQLRSMAAPPAYVNKESRALILDDDPDVLALMQTTLEGLGFEVETATNGAAALNTGLFGRFSLIVLDVNVPEISGIEVSRRLRGAGVTAKIFLFSAMPRREALTAVNEAQADGYIPKPYEFDYLVEKLRKSGLAMPAF